MSFKKITEFSVREFLCPNFSSSLGLKNIALYFCLLFIILFQCPSYGQVPPKEITIGQAIPDALWNEPLKLRLPSGKFEQVSLSKYRGKLIILDFWASWCSTCIASFPKGHALQQQFPDSLALIPVSDEKEEGALALLNRKTSASWADKLTTLIGKNNLSSYFPHQGNPHFVWISPGGKLITTTTTFELKAENIRAAYSGDKRFNPAPNVYQDLSRPIFSSDLRPLNLLSFSSSFYRGHIAGTGPGPHPYYSGKIVRGIRHANSPLFNLYSYAAKQLYPDIIRCVIESPDSATLRLPLSLGQETHRKYCATYELWIPTERSAELYSIMLDDLNRYSGYSGALEKKITRCLVITKAKAAKPFKGKLPIPRSDAKGSLVTFVRTQNGQGGVSMPLIDETGDETTGVGSYGPLDRSALEAVLSSLGLELKEAEREVQWFVIRNRINSKN